MRILLATGLFPPEIGGPATYAKLLADKLPRLGIEVEVLPFREVRGYPKAVRHFIYFLKIWKGARKADLIFTQDPVSTGAPAVLAGLLAGKRVVMRVAGDYAWEQSVQRYGVTDSIDDFQNKSYGFRVELLKSLQRWSVKRAYEVITPSEYFKKIVSGWAERARPVRRIYNGIDFAIEFERGGKYETPSIITAGRLVPWKGFGALIRVLKELPGWRLLVAGEGPERGALEELARSEKVSDRVVFLGNLERGKLLSEIAKSQVFVLNTYFESFSFQVVEAMFAGTPVVTTNIGNLKEIITDGADGMLVSPGDERGILSAVEGLHSDKELYSKISEAGKRRAKDFSIDKTLVEVAEVFKEAVGL